MNFLGSTSKHVFILTVLVAGLSCAVVFAGDTKAEKSNVFTFQGWTITLPGDWNGDAEAGVCWPGEGSIDMGRPPVSLHCGGIPVMPGTTFEDRIKSHINGEPKDRQKVTVEGLIGFTCTWSSQGNKHTGMFLEEVIGGGMKIIHFFDCQAPEAKFDGFKEVFGQIIKTVKK
jgi:hypothetical protein